MGSNWNKKKKATKTKSGGTNLMEKLQASQNAQELENGLEEEVEASFIENLLGSIFAQ